MSNGKTWSLLLGTLTALALVAALPAARADERSMQGTWIVHEWGTFLSVEGSDGTTLGGMIESEEELPRFVRDRDLNGLSRAQTMQKMETPVTYFYTDRPRQVRVRVDMERGLLTHWYPDVQKFGPSRSEKVPSSSLESFLDWGPLQVTPDNRFVAAGAGPGPAPEAIRLFQVGDSTWRFARDTDSALVKVRANGRDYWEKFLFYRGLGSFELPLEVRAVGPDDNLRLNLQNHADEPLRGLFAIWVQKGTLRFAALQDLPGGAARDLDVAAQLSAPVSLEDGVPFVKHAVADVLVQAGLYPREAQAMVNTWERSYFQTEGLRLLSVLPRSTVDGVIPIQIQPAPEQLVRLMMGRVEVLTPDREQHLEKILGDLKAKDPEVRSAAEAELNQLGRFREPVLRRIAKLTQLPEVRRQAETLLAQSTRK